MKQLNYPLRHRPSTVHVLARPGEAPGYVTLDYLREFISDHRPHGPLTADATEPAWNCYLLTVACGVVFGWVTPENAEVDLMTLASLN